MSVLDNIPHIPMDPIEKLANNQCNPKDFNCNASMTVTLHHSATFDIPKENVSSIIATNQNIDDVCCDDYNEKNSNSIEEQNERIVRMILLKLLPKRNEKSLLKLVDSISKCITIKGDSDSFAIVKVFNGDYISSKTTCIYDDFVTPGNTVDMSKLYRVIKIITDKMTKI